MGSKGLIQETPHVIPLIFLPVSLRSMSHVDFKKSLCGRVKFKGQGPLHGTLEVTPCPAMNVNLHNQLSEINSVLYEHESIVPSQHTNPQVGPLTPKIDRVTQFCLGFNEDYMKNNEIRPGRRSINTVRK